MSFSEDSARPPVALKHLSIIIRFIILILKIIVITHTIGTVITHTVIVVIITMILTPGPRA